MSALIVRAAEFARHVHHGRTQPDGSSYFDTHLMAVADVLFDAGASREVIAAGYLHCAVAQGLASLAQIELAFGAEVATLVDCLAAAPHAQGCNIDAFRARTLELERLAAECAEVQTIKLADDLVRLRKADFLDAPAREALLADVAAHVQYLLLADMQVRYQAHAALARWTDSGSTLLRALAIMRMPPEVHRH